MKLKLLLATIILLLGSFNLFAQTHSNEIGVETDNDSYLARGSDRYYTDGIFIYFRHALAVDSNSKLQNKVLGFEAGQKIFNPQSGTIALYPGGPDNPGYIDRPFAAYLYAGSTLNFLYNDESNLKLSAQLGMIGPDAYGKQVQTWVHKTFGFYHPSGWEYQIDNNAVLNLSAEYNRLLTRVDFFDVSLISYGNLGNGFSGAGAGPLLRFGLFNQLFNSISTQSTAIKKNKTTPLHKRELFAYYKPQFNWVAYDATIQGGLFTGHNADSMEVTSDKNPFMLSNEVGISYTDNRFVLNLAAIYNTKNTREMIRPHQWGAITGFYRFK
ncbi:lipid A deacylase LpxR family protein [Mucilaginibacter sp.]